MHDEAGIVTSFTGRQVAPGECFLKSCSVAGTMYPL